VALIPPILDNRSWADLRAELLARIPVYTPEWTDHNESDPGVALLELFAALGESLLYRFNQIPDTTKIEFLRLLGVRPRPARPARVVLTAKTARADGVLLTAGTEAPAGSVPFQLDDDVYVWPLTALGAGKTVATLQDTTAETERATDALSRAGVAADVAALYRTTLLGPDPLAPGAPVVDVSTQVDRALWIAVVRTPTAEVDRLRGRAVFVGVAFDEDVERPFALESLDAAGAAAFRADGLTADPPPVLWQLWAGDDAAMQNLRVLRDTTGGMVTTGVVALKLPDPLPEPGPGSGGEDSPPPLDDPRIEVAAWIRVARPAGSADTIRRVTWVGLNAVTAVQARTATPELLGTGTGDAGQRFALGHAPVLPGTVVLQVEEPAGWREWSEINDLAAAEPDERVYTVDLDDGTVTFGDGRVPQLGERIRVASYRWGGGEAGNVAPGAFKSVSGVEVRNPLPGVGGSDRVTLAKALDAIPAHVHRRDRAVTADDFRALAEEVTGVGRAEPLPRLHPDNPAVEAAGVVSVVVLPKEDRRDPEAPMPDLGLLGRVARYLDARRLVTTELYVIPPDYRPIRLSVGVEVRRGHQVDAVCRWVEQILRQYLAPLPPDGPDGAGWPLGRDVRRAELEAVAVQVEGVEYLRGDGLLLTDGTGPPTELVTLEAWQLPRITSCIVVGGRDPLPPGTGVTPAPSDPGKVPVPLPPDVC
jgi:hypothetical protein